MNFVEKERKALLEVKGVRPVVIQRFEEIGIHSLQELSEYEADDIAENGSRHAGNHLLEKQSSIEKSY